MNSYETSLRLYLEIEDSISELIQTLYMSHTEMQSMIQKYRRVAHRKQKVMDDQRQGSSASVIDTLNRLQNEAEELTLLEQKVLNIKYFISFLKNDIKSLLDQNSRISYHFFAENQEQVVSICLGQLKLIRKEYIAILKKIGKHIFELWLDRSIASVLNIFLIKPEKVAASFEKVYCQIETCFTEVFFMCQQYGQPKNEFQLCVLRRIFHNRFSLPTEVQVMNELLPG